MVSFLLAGYTIETKKNICTVQSEYSKFALLWFSANFKVTRGISLHRFLMKMPLKRKVSKTVIVLWWDLLSISCQNHKCLKRTELRIKTNIELCRNYFDEGKHSTSTFFCDKNYFFSILTTWKIILRRFIQILVCLMLPAIFANYMKCTQNYNVFWHFKFTIWLI